MASPRISLHPATTSLVPTLAQISSLAFAKDTHTLLKTKSTGIDHAEDMAPALEMWLAKPRERCQVITALIENENGKEVVGWACWAFRGFDGPVVEQEGNEDVEAEGEEEEVEQAVVLPPTDRGLEGEETEKKEKPKGIQRLEDITNSSMMQWSSKLSPEGSKNMILCAVTVHPSYQGKGVGKALINWGLEIADKEGVYCWVHASEAGWRVFERLGFAEVGRLEVDLDVYSSGVRNPLDEEGKWGQYMFRYMQREAINEK